MVSQMINSEQIPMFSYQCLEVLRENDMFFYPKKCYTVGYYRLKIVGIAIGLSFFRKANK